MKIKSVRHAGLWVPLDKMKETIKWYEERGGTIMMEGLDTDHEGNSCYVCKIGFEDDSIIELGTHGWHTALNVFNQKKTVWLEDPAGNLLECVPV